MYKMKEVCQMTGLTEKAIRIYMEQKLIEPRVEEGIHRKSYFFSDKDIERLKDISTLRSAGFGIAEIKQMQEKPEMLSVLIEERKEILENEILQKLAIQEALKNLTIVEHSDVSKLADAIEPRSAYAKETPKKKLSRPAKWGILLVIMALFFCFYGVKAGINGVWISMMAIGLVLGIAAIISGIRYLFYSHKVKKMKSRGIGTITAVVENENIEAYIGTRERSITKEMMALAVFGMFGEGLWDSLRPDAWYPVISYCTDDGEVHTATTRFGAFWNSWKIGERLELAWEDGKERLVHVCDGTVFRKKAYAYILFGMVLLALFGLGIVSLFGKAGKVTSIPTEQRLVYPADAERVEMQIEGKRYVLDEEEIEVIKSLLEQAEIRKAEKYIFYDTEGMVNLYFYRGEEEIEKFVVDDVNYIYASNRMKYWIEPISLEFRGVEMGDTEFLTVFFGNLKAKVLERYAVEEIIGSISEREEFKDLKDLLEVTENLDGAYVTQDGYQFIFTEKGFADYFGRQKKENEVGRLYVSIVDSEFQGAILSSCSYTESGEEHEIYRKEW